MRRVPLDPDADVLIAAPVELDVERWGHEKPRPASITGTPYDEPEQRVSAYERLTSVHTLVARGESFMSWGSCTVTLDGYRRGERPR